MVSRQVRCREGAWGPRDRFLSLLGKIKGGWARGRSTPKVDYLLWQLESNRPLKQFTNARL